MGLLLKAVSDRPPTAKLADVGTGLRPVDKTTISDMREIEEMMKYLRDR